MAYCRLQDNVDSQPKTFQIDLGGVKIKRTNATVNTHMITEDEIGERLLILENYKIDSDETIRDAHFLLKDLGPDEVAEIKEVRTLGSKIAIVELEVVPQELQPPQHSQPPNDVIITDR